MTRVRWRFLPEEQTASERAQRGQLLERCDAFWRAWQERDWTQAQGLLSEMDARLSLAPELLAPASAPACWVLRAQTPCVEPLRQTLFERAPADVQLPGAGQPRLEGAPARVAFGGKTLDLERSRVRVGVGRGHLLQVVVDPVVADADDVYAESAHGGHDAESYVELCEDLVELLLGERVLSRWVSDVQVASLPRGGALGVVNRGQASSHSLRALPGLVDTAIAGIVAGLASEPWHARPASEWTLFELEPRERTDPAADYALQDDALLAASCHPELLKTFLEGAPFFSGRFSATGELFAYVKFESRQHAFDARLLERDRLEAALHAQLSRSRAGAVVGNALGLRYSYVDLALTDVTRALPAIVEACRRLELAPRCWLLFFDSELRDEWLGLCASSAPPPALE